jgi:hypothetical protein
MDDENNHSLVSYGSREEKIKAYFGQQKIKLSLSFNSFLHNNLKSLLLINLLLDHFFNMDPIT